MFKKYYVEDEIDKQLLRVVRDNTPTHEPYYSDVPEDEDLSLYKLRMVKEGRRSQEGQLRMKKKTLREAILHSYFGFNIENYTQADKEYRVVIYPTDQEDEKLYSAFFTEETKIGDIIHWKTNDTYWLIYKQKLNEIAFFAASMLQCKNYQVSTLDGTTSTYANIRLDDDGTEENYDKTLLVLDDSIMRITMPDSEINRKFFKLHAKIKVLDTVWKIKSINYITTTGILKVKAERDFDTTVDITMSEETIPENVNTYIEGPNDITPLEEVTYRIVGNIEGEWTISDNTYIQKNINNDNELILTWTNPRKRRDFTISYGQYSKVVHISSLM